MDFFSRSVFAVSLAAISLGCGPQKRAQAFDEATPIEQSSAFKGLHWQRAGACSFAPTEGFRAAGMAEVLVASRQHRFFAKVPSDEGLRVSCPPSGPGDALPESAPVIMETPKFSTRLYTSTDASCLKDQACKERLATALRKDLADSFVGCTLPAFNAVWRRTESGDNVYIAHMHCSTKAGEKAGVVYMLLRGSAQGDLAGAYAMTFREELPPRADDEILMNLAAPGTFQVR